MELSLTIAGIIGPLLIILSISEYLNFKIWKDVHPTVVYLNGLVLLTIGLVIVQFHNVWILSWELIITLIGWLLLISGSIRMFFPKAQQAKKNVITDLILFILLLIGIFLFMKAYFI